MDVDTHLGVPGIIYPINKLKFDPYNPSTNTYSNAWPKRGFSNNVYRPGKAQLEMLATFDHIITQGRLIRLTTNPYWLYEDQYNGTVENGSHGVVGTGYFGPDGKLV